MNIEQIFNGNGWIFIIITLWSLPWKGVALWKASKRKEKKWFIALLVLNTFGILEILYIFIFSHDNKNANVTRNDAKKDETDAK